MNSARQSNLRITCCDTLCTVNLRLAMLEGRYNLLGDAGEMFDTSTKVALTLRDCNSEPESLSRPETGTVLLGQRSLSDPYDRRRVDSRTISSGGRRRWVGGNSRRSRLAWIA